MTDHQKQKDDDVVTRRASGALSDERSAASEHENAPRCDADWDAICPDCARGNPRTTKQCLYCCSELVAAVAPAGAGTPPPLSRLLREIVVGRCSHCNHCATLKEIRQKCEFCNEWEWIVAYLNFEEAGAVAPFDLLAHLHRQFTFSARAFGPLGEGATITGVIDHIRMELREIEAEPTKLSEWIDVAILAFDGAWRAGHTPAGIVAALVAKQAKNEARAWPDWRTADPDKAIEHVREAGASTPIISKRCTECHHVFTAADLAAEDPQAWGHPCHAGGTRITNGVTPCESFREPIGEAGAGAPPDALRSVQPRYDPSIEREYLESQEYANLLRAEAAERALASWRGWAQFVYLGGGEVPSLRTDAEMQVDVCGTHDRDVKAVLARAEAADQQREMLSGTVRQDAALIADLMGQKEAAERARDEKAEIIAALAAEKEVLRCQASAADHRQRAAEHRAQRIVLDAELKARAMAAEATLATLRTLVDEFETAFANALDTVSATVMFAQFTVPTFVKAVTAALTGDPAGPSRSEVAVSESQGEPKQRLVPLPEAAAPVWTGATPPSDFKVSMTVPPAPATLPVYQCEEWQCRYVFTDQMCCIRPLGHEGDHAPAILAARAPVPEARQPQEQENNRIREIWRSVTGPHAELTGPLIRFAAKIKAEARAAAQAPQDDLRVRAESLYEELGGDLCSCQRVDVPSWCERCVWRIGVIVTAFRRWQGEAASAPAPQDPKR
jgi:hypothetical protein